MTDLQTFTTAEVAPILKISVEQVRELIRRGRLHAVDVNDRKPDVAPGGRKRRHKPEYRVPEWSLRKFLGGEQQETAARPKAEEIVQ